MKRKSLSLSGLLTLVFSLAILCQSVEGGVTKICIVGNSMTIPRKFKAYPARLQEMMGDQYEIINSAVNGRTIIAHGPYPYVVEKKFKEIFDHKPNIITIMLGTNDTKTMHWKDSADFEPDYRMLVDSLLTIRATPPDGGAAIPPKMFLCYPPKVQVDCWKCGGKHDIKDPVIKNAIIPIIDKIAKDKNLGVIDTYTPFIGKKELYGDKLHFTGDGHQFAAEILEPILSNVRFKPDTGCTDSTYLKYSPKANVHDQSKCGEKIVKGCMEAGYQEHNPKANVHDSSMCKTGLPGMAGEREWLRSPIVQRPGFIYLSLRDNSSWKLSDLQGRPVWVIHLREEGWIILQTSLLQPGVYILTLENSSGAMVQKLMVH